MQPAIDHFHARLFQRVRHNFRAAIMSIKTGLCY
jgi:hypothetical protein